MNHDDDKGNDFRMPEQESGKKVYLKKLNGKTLFIMIHVYNIT